MQLLRHPPPTLPPPTPELDRWFSSEIRPLEPGLRAYLRGRFPTLQSELDDLVQETYVRIFKAKQTGKMGLSRAYLYVVARNLALDFFRRRRVVTLEGVADLDRLCVVEDRPDAAEAAIHEQELEILAEAIHALPDRCRDVFVLRRFEEASHKDIATRLGMAENTVNAHLVTAMLKVRAYLRTHGVNRVEAR